MNPYRLLTFASLLLAAAAVSAASTNIIYVPFSRASIGVPTKAQQLQAAMKLPECRPAELDPEGHWGEVAAGVQLGMRFSTNTFRVGQPIEMRVILRNTTTNVVTLPFANSGSIEPFVVKDGKPVPVSGSWLYGSRGRPMLPLPPLSQMEYSPYDLSRYFESSGPGLYQVFAKCRQSPFAPGLPEIKSAPAEITVAGSAAK